MPTGKETVIGSGPATGSNPPGTNVSNTTYDEALDHGQGNEIAGAGTSVDLARAAELEQAASAEFSKANPGASGRS